MSSHRNDRFYDEPPRRSRAEVDEVEYRERTRLVSRSPPRRSTREYSDNLRFLRDDVRPIDAGPLVLRQREIETVERPRARSPSPVYRERIVRRARSLTPPHHSHEHEHERETVRISERERIRSPSRGPRTRFVERVRSPSPPAVERVRTRVVERRPRSPSPVEHERIRTRIVERERERERAPSISSSSSASPPPQFIRGPTIERQVITHYHDIDHGVTKVPSPPPPPRIVRRTEERELDIDISTSRNRTEVDIHRSTSRVRGGRSRSRERRSPRYSNDHVHEDQLVVHSSRNELRVEDRHSHRRSRSAAPLRSPVAEEAEYITSKIDSRGRMGEAWNGATKDWTIVDVPPGTERVRMDGVGGGAAEVTWQRYNGVRRSKFIPERDGVVATSSTTVVSEPPPRASRDRLSVAVYDRDREIDIEKVTDRRIALRPSPPTKRNDMWTEITKDLVTRDAIIELGYEYEETEYFFYIMEYLRYDDVLQLVQRSDEIRRFRKHHHREVQWERDTRREDIDIRLHHHHHHRRPRRTVYDDGRVVEREREVVYDDRRWR